MSYLTKKSKWKKICDFNAPEIEQNNSVLITIEKGQYEMFVRNKSKLN